MCPFVKLQTVPFVLLFVCRLNKHDKTCSPPNIIGASRQILIVFWQCQCSWFLTCVFVYTPSDSFNSFNTSVLAIKSAMCTIINLLMTGFFTFWTSISWRWIIPYQSNVLKKNTSLTMSPLPALVYKVSKQMFIASQGWASRIVISGHMLTNHHGNHIACVVCVCVYVCGGVNHTETRRERRTEWATRGLGKTEGRQIQRAEYTVRECDVSKMKG